MNACSWSDRSIWRTFSSHRLDLRTPPTRETSPTCSRPMRASAVTGVGAGDAVMSQWRYSTRVVQIDVRSKGSPPAGIINVLEAALPWAVTPSRTTHPGCTYFGHAHRDRRDPGAGTKDGGGRQSRARLP